jgi:uncharacterized lipoprotein YajG
MKKLLTLAALLVSVVLAGCVNTSTTQEVEEPVAPVEQVAPVVEPTPVEVMPETTPAAEAPAAEGTAVEGTAVEAMPEAPVVAE